MRGVGCYNVAMTKISKPDVYQGIDWLEFHLSFLVGAENLLQIIVDNERPDTAIRRNIIPATRLFKHSIELGIKYLLTKLGVDFRLKKNRIHKIDDLLTLLHKHVPQALLEDKKYKKFIELVRKWVDLQPFKKAISDHSNQFESKPDYHVPTDEDNFLFHYPDDEFMYTLLISGLGINEKIAKQMLDDLRELKGLYAHLVHSV